MTSITSLELANYTHKTEWCRRSKRFYCSRRAPHKPVVTVRCTSVTYPKFYGDNTESPTLVVVAYVVRASGVPENLQYQNGKPHMLRNTWSIWHPMLPLIPEKSDLKGDEDLSAKVNEEFWRRFVHTVHGVLPMTWMTQLPVIVYSEIKPALTARSTL